MLFLEAEIEQEEKRQTGHKGGISKQGKNGKFRKEEVNTDFMYVNYEV